MKAFSVLTLVCTFVLLIAGGLVHSTGSGLACPDWPLCFGTLFPVMEGGVLFEHSHRLIAGSVAILTLLLTITIFRKTKDRGLRSLGLVVFFLVIFQAGLGGLTVIYKLPMLISTAHLATAMFFFSLLVTLAVRIRIPLSGSQERRQPWQKLMSLRPWLFLAIVLIYGQIVLGAFVRHSGSGGVCPSFPLCEGSLWPFQAHPAIRLHMAHRLFAFVVAFMSIGFAIRVKRLAMQMETNSFTKNLEFLALAIPILMVTQILLGIATVLTHVDLIPAIAHLAVAALLLGTMVSLWTCIPQPQDSGGLLADLFSLTKARLTSLVLIVTTVTYYLAADGSDIPTSRYFYTLLGTFLLVAGSAFLNAFFERDVDAFMERTKNRPLPGKRLPANLILTLGILLGLLGVPLLAFAVNPVTGFLGALAYVSYAFLYTPLKAKTSLAALIGAIPGAMPPLMGWTAVTGSIDLVGATLFFILFFWQLPHFLAIAIYRREEYGLAGLKVMPNTEGDQITQKLMMRYSAMLIPISLFLVPLGVAGHFYFYAALGLGLIYFFWTCYGIRPFPARSSHSAWARSLFLYSLVYLPALFVVLLLDAKIL